MPDSLTLGVKLDCPTQESAQRIGFKLLQKIQDILSGPRTGRWYPVPGNVFYEKITPKKLRAKNYWVKYAGTINRDEILGAAYRASAPGEPPAPRTGRLRQSFFLTIIGNDSGGFSILLRTNVEYADDLEFGREKLDPRPFIAPAVAYVMPDIVAANIRHTLRIITR